MCAWAPLSESKLPPSDADVLSRTITLVLAISHDAKGRASSLRAFEKSSRHDSLLASIHSPVLAHSC